MSTIAHHNPTDDDAAAARLRQQQRLLWARTALVDADLTLHHASADASFRSYWRGVSGGHSWIVMDAPPAHEDIRPWLEIAARLRAAGLNAPQVRLADADAGFVLMNDLGTRLYLPALTESSADALYGDALDALLTMQTRADAHGLPAYDEAKLVAEMELMPTWFLQRHLGYTPTCEEWDVIEPAFRALLDAVRVQPQVFVHRDYHARNLLVTAAQSPGIIDFQDAVRGPVTYDLVSLLRDCYIAWPEARVQGWVEDYRRRLVDAGITTADPATFLRWFDLTGLQRHLKVLGIFCRLCYRDGKADYLRDLPLVWRYVREVGARHPQTAPLIELLARVIGVRDLTMPTASPTAGSSAA